MAALDEISHKIGQLQSTVDHIYERQKAHAERQQNVAMDVADLKRDVRDVKEDVKAMQSPIADYTKLRGTLAFIGMGVISFSAFIGSIITYYVQKKWLS